MKPSISNSIATILFVATLSGFADQTAFANTFTVLTDLGKELATLVLSSPLAALSDLRRGRNSAYGVRSIVGFSPMSPRTGSFLSSREAERTFKREQKERDRIVAEYRRTRERKRKLAQKSTPDLTDFLVYWRGVYKSGFWFYRMYTSHNAKKKLTKADEARRQEYFCGDNDEEKLKEYCAKALSDHSAFFEEKGWRYDPDESPVCELKSVILDQYDYTSQRGVLTCPIVVSREGENDEHTFVYISSVDNPPKNRLSFYIFTEADDESIDEHAQKFPPKDTQPTPKSSKKDQSQASSVLKNIRPAMSILKAATSPGKSLTKSVLLPASTFAIRALQNTDGGGIKSYVPFMSSKKTNAELPTPGRPLKVVSLVVHKKS